MGGRGASSSIGRGSGAGKPNDATEEYVNGFGGYSINSVLRSGKPLSEDEKEYVKQLDLATNGKVKEDELYRVIDARALMKFDDEFQEDDFKAYLILGENSDYFGGNYMQNRLSNIKSKINNIVGKNQIEKGYMSTTKDLDIAKHKTNVATHQQGAPVILNIKETKGAKGVDLSSYDKPNGTPEKEILLGRNQNYKINKIYAKDGTIYADATLKK